MSEYANGYHLQDDALVDVERRAMVAMDRLEIEARQHHRRRPRSFTPTQALRAIEFEATVVWVASATLRDKHVLSDEDHARVLLAVSRIGAIVEEVVDP